MIVPASNGQILTTQTPTIRTTFGVGIETLAVFFETGRFPAFASVLMRGRLCFFWRHSLGSSNGSSIVCFLLAFGGDGSAIGRHELTPKRSWIPLQNCPHGVSSGIDVFCGVVASVASTEERIAECVGGEALAV